MNRSTAFSALAVFALLPAGASAQVAADDSAIDLEAQAEMLTEQAYLMANQRSDFETAASWLRQAAEIQTPSATTVRSLMNAGHFHFYSRRSLDAVSAFKSAAELALELGDRDTAAEAFRNGAFAADRGGDLVTAREMLDLSTALRTQTTVAAATQK